jgi:hypothetical protein
MTQSSTTTITSQPQRQVGQSMHCFGSPPQQQPPLLAAGPTQPGSTQTEGHTDITHVHKQQRGNPAATRNTLHKGDT